MFFSGFLLPFGQPIVVTKPDVVFEKTAPLASTVRYYYAQTIAISELNGYFYLVLVMAQQLK